MKLSGEEREYWKCMKAALQHYCQENVIETLDRETAHALRHDFHREFLHGQDKSHTEFDHHDYSVAFAWLRAYAKGGLIEASLMDVDKVRDESRRKSAMWRIDKTGRDYMETIARDRLKLPEFEAVDWSKIDTDTLCQIAMTATNRERSWRAGRGLSKSGRSLNRMDDMRRKREAEHT